MYTPQSQTLAPKSKTKIYILALIMHCSLMWGRADPCSRHGVRAKVKWHIAWRTTVFLDDGLRSLTACRPQPEPACPLFSL